MHGFLISQILRGWLDRLQAVSGHARKLLRNLGFFMTRGIFLTDGSCGGVGEGCS